ncbi:UNVERIFIED_CONTAM: hypothetical protein GTU68_009801 [Idotea baltica]|nr:hypothetical protein [Idotea baltica]
MRLLPQPMGQITGGQLRFQGRDLVDLPLSEMHKIRGNDIGMVFQEPMTALNPVHTIGRQLTEVILLHRDVSADQAIRDGVEMLARVGIPAPDIRMGEYPHQLSGGMRQRVVIAIALACEPKLLIADEPTTALDVTIQAQILDLIKELQNDMGMAVILITHDLGVIAETSNDVVVMYAGRVAEQGTVFDIFDRPAHPYTRGLLASIPRLDTPPKSRLHIIDALCGLQSVAIAMTNSETVSNVANMEKPLLEVNDLQMHFPVKEGVFLRTNRFNRAVDGVSFSIGPGETLGLVGESGCGKSTLGRCVSRLYKPSGGTILFEGQDITHMRGSKLLPVRQHIQMIFQDPMESLNARHTVGEILEEPFIIHKLGDKAFRRQRVRELLDTVGLPARSASRYPFEFSGGQRQRIGIARAVALNPKLIICDEPVSALDVSIQSQILNLLNDLQREFGLSYLFIAHDLAVVKHISDRIAIMYLGKIVESADSERIYQQAAHPYTQSLISAIPVPDPHRTSTRQILSGDVPSPIDPPSGCHFHPRCPVAMERCSDQRPELLKVARGHNSSCHLSAGNSVV